MARTWKEVRAEALATGKLAEKRIDARRDQLAVASDAIGNDPAEQAELRRIMAEMDRISAW